MTEENQPILPLLKDANWLYSDKSLCRRLTPDLDTPHVPWVAFGYDQPSTFAFLPDEHGLQRRNLAVIERRAIENLQHFPAKWKKQEFKFERFKKLKLLICTNSFFAAEHSLIPEFMRKGETLLKSKRLLVGLPRRSLMLAIVAKQSNDNLSKFAGLVSLEYHNAQSAQISPIVFVFENGVIIGQLKGGEDVGKQMLEAADPGEDIYIRGMWGKKGETDEETMLLVAGAADLERLELAISNVFVQALSDCLANEKFSGAINIFIIKDLTPESSEVDQLIQRLQKNLMGVVADITRLTEADKPITVSVQYGIGDDEGA